MRFAIYTRKSTFSESSDSVKNQDRMCRDYIKLHFPDKVDAYLNYEDEDFTGANTNRPALKKMMKDIEAGIIDFLIVYQLDRLSRDVRDFSNIYSFLEERNVQFISVKENIDTSTPLGKAMMYVSVVFAQMERETIASRVYDNMVGLAGEGWWTGGNPPYGYRRIKVTERGKLHTCIEPVPEEAERVEWFFRLFLKLGVSLQGFETYCHKNEIRTPKGKIYQTAQLHRMLTMPYCAPATPEVYDHYKEKGCIMADNRERWDGKHGVMIYDRTSEKTKKHTSQPPEKWRVCVGKQEPFLPADLWLAVQNQFTHNVIDKRMKYPTTLLKGVLRCKCGRLMGLARRPRKGGQISTWYLCPKHDRFGHEVCDTKQIKCELLDNKVIEIFRNIQHDHKLIYDYFDVDYKDDAGLRKGKVDKEITTIENKISNLSVSLASNTESSAAKYIIAEIENLDRQLSEKKNEAAGLQAEELLRKENEKNAKDKLEMICDLMDNFDSFSIDEKNAIMKKCIKKCVWDNETLFLTL